MNVVFRRCFAVESQFWLPEHGSSVPRRADDRAVPKETLENDLARVEPR
jgi:hypothetical protein